MALAAPQRAVGGSDHLTFRFSGHLKMFPTFFGHKVHQGETMTGPYQPQPYQPQYQPSKSHKARNIVLSLLGALIVIIIVSVAVGTAATSHAHHAPASQPATGQPAPAGFHKMSTLEASVRQQLDKYLQGKGYGPSAVKQVICVPITTVKAECNVSVAAQGQTASIHDHIQISPSGDRWISTGVTRA